jgi:peroxiredoxin/uncharacterized membrane protein YphA (DoxX/SURF4 family)
VSAVLLVLRLLLAGVFAVAGVAKLFDRKGARAAADGFGLPAAFAAPIAIGLPLVELAIAVVLIPAATARAGAFAALVLLASFCVGIANAMLRGRAPDCHCFGALHSAPAGPATLARNAGLAAAAAGVLVGTPISPTAWLGGLTSAELTAVLVAAGALALAAASATIAWQLLRAHGRLLRRIERLEGAGEPAAGVPAPAFTLPSLDGRTVSLERLRAAGAPVLVVFTNPDCGPCRTLLPTVARWQRELTGRLTVALISGGDAARMRSEADAHGLRDVLLSPDREVARAYEATGTPAAVLVGADGLRRGDIATGPPAIEALVRSATGIPAAPPAPSPAPALEVVPSRRIPTPGRGVGERAGAIDLPTLDGGRFVLGERERPTLLVSWNPGCGFCRKMVEPLREALAAAGADAPDVVLLARGEIEANRALDAPATLALDADGSIAGSLGAAGTPIGVLVDARGRIAAAPAVGADATLALLREPSPVVA